MNNLEKYLDLTKRLVVLNEEELYDTDEAEDLRCELDEVYWELTDEERIAANKVLGSWD